MATWRASGAGGGSSGTGNRTVTVTTAVSGDLLVVFVSLSANTTTTPTMTDDHADGLGTYTRIGTALWGTSANNSAAFVRDAKLGSTDTSFVITCTSGSNSAGEISWVAIQNSPNAGISAIRSYGSQADQASGTTPAPALNQAALTGNVTIAAVMSGDTTTTEASGWTERSDTSQSNPTTACEHCTRDSGFTGTTITFGATCSTTFASWAVEIESGYVKTLTESSTLTATPTKGAGKDRTETATLTDSVHAVLTAITLTAALTLSDPVITTEKATAHSKELTELTTLTDERRVSPIFTESIGLSDTPVKEISRTLTESASLTSSLATSLFLTETISLADTLTAVGPRSGGDWLVPGYGNVKETVSTNRQWILPGYGQFQEGLGASAGAAQSKELTDTLSLTDSITSVHVFGAVLTETVGLTANAYPGLLADYWTGFELEEASGTRYPTITRYDNPGDPITLTSGYGYPGQAEAPIGYGAAFDGVDDVLSHPAIGTGCGFDVRQDWTVTGWFRRLATGPLSEDKHLYGWQCGGTGEVYHTWLDTSNTPYLKFAVWSPSSKIAEVTSVSTFGDVSWHFMVLRHDSAAKTISLQVDNGTPVTSSAYTGTINSSTSVLTLGSEKLNDNYFPGDLTSNHYWTRLLSTGEATKLFNGEIPLRYPFDGTGQAGPYHKRLLEDQDLSASLETSRGIILTESATLGDSHSKGAGKTLTDATVLGDSHQQDVARTISKTVSLGDTLATDHSSTGTYNKTLTETAGLTDVWSKQSTAERTFTQVATLSGTINFGRTSSPVETASLSDSLTIVATLYHLLLESVTLTDSVEKGQALTLTEAVTLTDSISSGAQRDLAETLALTDTVQKEQARELAELLWTSYYQGSPNGPYLLLEWETGTKTKSLVEGAYWGPDNSPRLLDAQEKGTGREISEQASLTDTLTWTQTEKNLAELVTLSDSVSTQLGHAGEFSKELTETATLLGSVSKDTSRTISDAAGLSDQANKGASRAISESVTLAASVLKGAGRELSDSLTLSDTFTRGASTFARTLTESAVLTDTVNKGVGRTWTDGLTLSATPGKGAGKQLSDAVVLSDTYARGVATFNRTVSEIVLLSDSLQTTFQGTTAYDKTLTETLALDDTKRKDSGHVITDSLLLTDTTRRDGSHAVSETILLTDTVNKRGGKVLLESQSLSDSYVTQQDKHGLESVVLLDSFVNRAITRTITDTVTLADSIVTGTGIGYSTTLTELITLVDEPTMGAPVQRGRQTVFMFVG